MIKPMYFYLLLLAFTVNAADENDSVAVITSDSQVEGVDELAVGENSTEELPIIIKDALQQARTDGVVIGNSRQHYIDSENALKLFHEPKALKSITVPLSLEPGQNAYPIDVAINYGATIFFKDTNGESLFVHRYKAGIADVINVDDGSGGENGEKLVTSYLTLTNARTLGSTNLHVWLMNMEHSLSFHTKIVESPDEYVDRITFVVVNPSEMAANNVVSVDSYDALTLALNNRKPDTEAKKIRFDDPSVSGWRKGDMMWLRTSSRLVFPTHSPKMALSSDKQDGINVYYVAAHPIIHIVDGVGKFKKLTMMDDIL